MNETPCTCHYPALSYDTGSGHRTDCPQHAAWARQQEPRCPRSASTETPAETALRLQAERQAVCQAATRSPDVPVLDLVAAFAQGMALLEQEIAAIQACIADLATQDCVRATPHYRKSRSGQRKYLYLIHPTAENGSRKREYIGADPAKQAQALASVARFEEREQLKDTLDQRRAARRAAIADLHTALHTLQAGHCYPDAG